MNRGLLLMIVAAWAAPVWAAGETVPTLGLAPGSSNQRSLCIFDQSVSRPCVNIGPVDSGNHLFVQYPTINVRNFGAKGNGTTDDTAAIQSAINALLTLGGGTLYLPRTQPNCYKTTTGIDIDATTVTGAFQRRINIVGDGPAASCIRYLGTGPAILYTGSLGQDRSYFRMSNIALLGLPPDTGGVCNTVTANSVGFAMSLAAWASIDSVNIQGFDYGMSFSDVDQLNIQNSVVFQNGHGVAAINGAPTFVYPQTWSFINDAIGGSCFYGVSLLGPNQVNFVNGSIQYNGATGSGAGHFGVGLTNIGLGGAGAGDQSYSTATFTGVTFEGNGGLGDISVSQTTPADAVVNVIGSSFERTGGFPGVGYGTNNIVVGGTKHVYLNLYGNTFTSSGYTPDAARPTIAVSTKTLVADDGTNFFQNVLEVPVYNKPVLTSCGTDPAIVGTNFHGKVTMGTANPVGCTITFAPPFVSAPDCTVAWMATPLASQSYTVSSTAITLTQTATSSNSVSYVCKPNAGG